jgi:hypothetical protein
MSEPRPFDRRTSVVALGANLAVEATAAEVVGALGEAGVRSVLLKGPSLARWLYDSNEPRLSIDVDLMIAPDDRATTEAVLTRLGFESFPSNVNDESRHAGAWERPVDPVGVDVHLNLAGVGVSNDEAWRLLSRDTTRLSVGGIEVEVFAPPARALHVALHAAQHGARWEWGVQDLSRALNRLPLELWRRAAALADSLDATPALVAGLRLLPEGEELRVRLGLPTETTIEAALRATTPPDLALGLHRLAATAGVRRKASFLAGKLFPNPAWMRSWLPLARRGRLGLAAAYGWRPLWFLVRTPAAIRALRKARRTARPRPER